MAENFKSTCIIILVVLLIVYANKTSNHNNGLSERFIGTYQCEIKPEHIISVSHNGIIYYINQMDETYDKGYYEKIDYNLYRVISDVLGEQKIKFDGLYFDITISGEECEFKKVLDLPSYSEPLMSEELSVEIQ